MDIYLTHKDTGVRLRIPLLPDRLSVKTGASTVSLNIINTGEVKIPRGSALTGYSWSGVFPSESMADASYVFDWQEPTAIIKLLEQWQASGSTLTLMVTDLSINADVYIDSFTYEFYGIGDASYTLSLTKRVELYVTTAPAPASASSDGSTSSKTGTVTGSRVNVRKGPGTSYASYGTLPRGTQVEVLEQSGNWYKIKYEKGDEGVGWMCATYVKLTTATTSTGTSKSSSSSGSKSGGSSSSSKKSSSKSSGKKTSSAKSTTSKDTTSAKSLTVKKPTTSLINAAKSAVKSRVTVSSSAISAKKRIDTMK